MEFLFEITENQVEDWLAGDAEAVSALCICVMLELGVDGWFPLGWLTGPCGGDVARHGDYNAQWERIGG